MVHETLNELQTLSTELAELKGKPPATPQPIPDRPDLHPELAAILAEGTLALTLQGVDLGRIDKFTKDARSRGMRRKAVVFGWHPRGHTWYATPDNRQGDATVLVIDRTAKLATTELDIPGFLELCAERTRAAITKAKAPKKKPEAEAAASAPSAEPQRRKGRAPLIVRPPENNGATTTAAGKVEHFDSDEFGYLLWVMNGLQMVTEGEAPDLSRWEVRCLRACRLDAVPEPSSPDWARYDAEWLRLSRRDRAAPGPISYQISSHKLTVAGRWILAPNEVATLRRSERAIAPRHRPTAAQKKLWKRWVSMVTQDLVEIEIH